MSLDLTGERADLQTLLMPGTCTLTPYGATAVSSACGIVDPSRTPSQPLRRGGEGSQLQPKASVVFRLPYAAPDLPLGSTIVYSGKTYAVVDPGMPQHGMMLARYVGCEEVPA